MKLLLIVVGLLIILFLSTVYIISPFYKRKAFTYESIKKDSFSYYYYYSNSDSTDIRNGIYIFNLSDSDSLKKYYMALNDSVEPIAFFKGGVIEMSKPLYIVEYFGSDSLIAKIIDSNNREAYVYTPLLHTEKPQ